MTPEQIIETVRRLDGHCKKIEMYILVNCQIEKMEIPLGCFVVGDIPKSRRRRTPVRKTKIVESTFRYKWWNQCPERLALLYQALLRAPRKAGRLGWIDGNTTPDEFVSLFSGNENKVQVIWTGTRQHLKYLIKVMLKRGYIFLPDGSKQPWVIAKSHFVDAKRQPFMNWEKEKEPMKFRHTIEELADILDPDNSYSSYSWTVPKAAPDEDNEID